jgi:hypothetical protein
MGGTDDSSNIIELTIEEHANAHRVLWEQYGKEEDYIAWKGLSGSIGMDDIIIEVSRMAGKKNKGKPKPKGFSEKISSYQSGRKKSFSQMEKRIGENHWTKKRHVDTSKNIHKLVECKICGKVTTIGNIARWHKHDGVNKKIERDERGRFI